MKETQQTPDTAIEVKANKDQEKKYNYLGSIDLKSGQKLFGWKFNTTFDEIFEVDLKDEKNYHFFEGQNGTKIKRIVIMPDHIYECAINRKNAARKLLARFGFKFNTSKSNYTLDMPTEKLPDEFIEIGRPEGPQPNTIDTEAKVIDLNTTKNTENE